MLNELFQPLTSQDALFGLIVLSSLTITSSASPKPLTVELSVPSQSKRIVLESHLAKEPRLNSLGGGRHFHHEHEHLANLKKWV